MPKYRIYWQCGISTTHEVEAESLEKAIEKSEGLFERPNVNYANNFDLDGDWSVYDKGCEEIED